MISLVFSASAAVTPRFQGNLRCFNSSVFPIVRLTILSNLLSRNSLLRLLLLLSLWHVLLQLTSDLFISPYPNPTPAYPFLNDSARWYKPLYFLGDVLLHLHRQMTSYSWLLQICSSWQHESPSESRLGSLFIMQALVFFFFSFFFFEIQYVSLLSYHRSLVWHQSNSNKLFPDKPKRAKVTREQMYWK